MELKAKNFAGHVLEYKRRLGIQIIDSEQDVWEKFYDHLTEAIAREDCRWTALCLPTGLGKTAAAKIYCSMIEPDDRLGVLFVNRTRDGADDVASGIRQFAGDSRALAAHGLADNDNLTVRSAKILSITHAGLDRAVLDRAQGQSKEGRLRYVDEWAYGRRGLVIIDEAPSLVRTFTITQHDASLLQALQTSTCIPALAQLSPVLASLQRHCEELRADPARHESFLTESEITRIQEFDFVGAIRGFNLVHPDELKSAVDWKLSRSEFLTSAKKVLTILQNMGRIGSVFAAKSGHEVSLSASESSMANDLGGIILDGTANIDSKYEIVSNLIKVKSIGQTLRTYGNVTLHVARGHKVGKDHLSKKFTSVWPPVLESARSIAGADFAPFVVSHKDVEDGIKSLSEDSIEGSFGHYNNITGRNDWRERCSAIIFGLPFLNPIALAQTTVGLRAIHRNGTAKDQQDGLVCSPLIMQELRSSHNSVQVVQAVNRITCRKAANKRGECADTRVFILLPNGTAGDRVLVDIQASMPGVIVQDWSPARVGATASRRTSSHALLTVLQTLAPGSYASDAIRMLAGVSPRSLSRFLKEARSPHDEVAIKLAQLGVTYRAEIGAKANCRFDVRTTDHSTATG